MAVSKMKFVSIIGLLSGLDDVIKACGKSEAFQPDEAARFYSNMKGFSALNGKNPYTMLHQIMKDTMESSGVSPDLVDIKNFKVDKDEIDNYVSYISSKLGVLISQRNDINFEIEKIESSIKQVRHFTGQNLNLQEIFACKYIKVRLGRLPKESFMKLQTYDENPYVIFFPCTSDQTHYWGVYFAPLEYKDTVDRIFASLYFERVRVEGFEGTPEEHLNELKKLGVQKRDELKVIEKKIDAFWVSNKQQCMRFYTKVNELNIYFGIEKYVYKYKKSFILVGWVLEENEPMLKEMLDKLEGIEYAIERADETVRHNPPVYLMNKRFFKPFEFFLGMYGLPSYDEIDPTPLFAVTYMFLFGMMFGDFGHGVVLFIIGWLCVKYNKLVNIGRIVMLCGIPSAVCGIIYGSFFGNEHAFDWLYKLIGLSSKPVKVMEEPLGIIAVTIVLGILIIITSMSINIYSSIRNKDYEEAYLGHNGVAGLVMYTSLIIGATCQFVLGIPLLNFWYLLLFFVIPLLAIFFKKPLYQYVTRDPDWRPQKWGEYVLENFFELFEILLSFASNSMSFLRVGVYAIMHVGLMMIFEVLAEMLPSVGYVAMLVFGNIFVIILEGFLVGIQVLRLEFYEIFSRFFKGEGKAFAPIKVKKVHTL